MNLSKNKLKKRGMTLIEVIISIAILSIVIVPISNMALTSVKINKEAEDKQQAVLKAQQILEEIKSITILKSFQNVNLSNGITLQNNGTSFQGNNIDPKGNGVEIDISPKDGLSFQGPVTNNIDFATELTVDGTNSSSTVKISNNNVLGAIENKTLFLTFEGSNISIDTGTEGSRQHITTYTLEATKNIKVNIASTYTCDNTDINIYNNTSEVVSVYVDKKQGASGGYTVNNKGGIVRNYMNYSSETGNSEQVYLITISIYKNNGRIYQLKGYKSITS